VHVCVCVCTHVRACVCMRVHACVFRSTFSQKSDFEQNGVEMNLSVRKTARAKALRQGHILCLR
jgi:hypothetical protein